MAVLQTQSFIVYDIETQDLEVVGSCLGNCLRLQRIRRSTNFHHHFRLSIRATIGQRICRQINITASVVKEIISNRF